MNAKEETDHVRCAGSVRVARVGGGGSGVMCARVVVGVAQVGFAGAVPLVDHQVDGHLALQTADVTVAKVVAELVNLLSFPSRRDDDDDEMNRQNKTKINKNVIICHFENIRNQSQVLLAQWPTPSHAIRNAFHVITKMMMMMMMVVIIVRDHYKYISASSFSRTEVPYL